MVCSLNRKLNSNEKNCFYLRQCKESYNLIFFKISQIQKQNKTKTKNNHTTWLHLLEPKINKSNI